MKHGLSAEMAGPDASNKQSLHGFEELFSLVPTTSKTLTDPKLKHVALYIFEEGDRSRPPWTFNRRTPDLLNALPSASSMHLREQRWRVVSLFFIDRRLFESTTRPADGPAGDGGSRFSNTDDTSLSLDMLSDAEYRGSHLAKAFGTPSKLGCYVAALPKPRRPSGRYNYVAR